MMQTVPILQEKPGRRSALKGRLPPAMLHRAGWTNETAAHPNYLQLMGQSIKRHSESWRGRQRERTPGPVVEPVRA